MLLQLGEDVTELGVVDEDAVVEVEWDLLIGDDVEAVVILATFGNLLGDAVEFLTLTGGEVGGIVLKFLLLVEEPLDVREQVLGADALRGVRVHAMHVGDALEGTLLAAEEPVDRAILVHLLVILPEVLHEVIVNALA